MMRALNKVFIVAATALVAGCGSITPNVPDVERTWLSARAYMPGQIFATTPAKIVNTQRLPVVLYFHGCTGLWRHDYQWADELKTLGFVVIAPDSFARAERKPNCDPRTHQTGYFPQAMAMRDEEIRHAVQRVRQMPWADPNNIYVMGHSEGGRAVTTNAVSGVRGTIISGWSCSSRRNAYNGIAHPNSHPTLILEWERDPCNRGAGSCEQHLAGRSQTTYIKLRGEGHGSVESPRAREAARDFLLKMAKPQA